MTIPVQKKYPNATIFACVGVRVYEYMCVCVCNCLSVGLTKTERKYHCPFIDQFVSSSSLAQFHFSPAGITFYFHIFFCFCCTFFFTFLPWNGSKRELLTEEKGKRESVPGSLMHVSISGEGNPLMSSLVIVSERKIYPLVTQSMCQWPDFFWCIIFFDSLNTTFCLCLKGPVNLDSWRKIECIVSTRLDPYEDLLKSSWLDYHPIIWPNDH